MNALVEPARGLADVLLHQFGQLDALLHILVLHQLKEDVALRRVGVEALVVLLIVVLIEYDGVLALGHLQVLFKAVGVAVAAAATQGVGLVAAADAALRHGVDMYRHKEVGLVAVGHLGTLPQLQEAVVLAGVHHAHVGAVLLHDTAEGQGIAQRQRLLRRLLATGAGVLAAVAGVYHQGKHLLGAVGRQHHSEQYPDNH